MADNRDLFKKLKSGRSRFYPIDLHIHTPASTDVGAPPHIDKLSDEIKEALSQISKTLVTDPISYEDEVIKKIPVDIYYTEILKKRDLIADQLNLEDTGGWAIVALTDHNVCKYSCQVAAHAWSQLKENQLVVLPGIELSVNYSLESGGGISEAHILCLFRPNTIESDIRKAISDASGEDWTPGSHLEVKSLPNFINNLRNHDTYPGICIAAHVSSGKGLQAQTKEMILSRRDAAISRLKGEISKGVEPDIDSLNVKLDELIEQRDSGDEIAIEVLELIGECGFDALQVRGKQDEIHYKRLHRYVEEAGRAVPIVCSDAHTPGNIFNAESGIPHLKLTGLSSTVDPIAMFDSIRAALRLGETRFNYLSPENPASWISGIEITSDAPDSAKFWPFQSDGDDNLLPFILPMSRNLNCIIGGRGSGKSAALEALAFVTKPEDFNLKNLPTNVGDTEFYQRAKATIAGCTIKVCWQFPKNELTKTLPKKAIFQSRYFEENGNHSKIDYYSIGGEELVREQIPPLTIQYYRLGEIEKQADPKQLRGLFDSICGSKIFALDSEIEEFKDILKSQREEMVTLSELINDLTSEDSPLREYLKRKRLFEKVNTDEISSMSDELDKLSHAQESTRKAMENWSLISDQFDSENMIIETDAFFKQIEIDSIDSDGGTLPHHDQLLALAKNKDNNDQNSLRKEIGSAISNLGDKMESVEGEIKKVDDALNVQVKKARKQLQEKGLPSGIHDRDAKKEAFDSAKEDLQSYKEFMEKWDALNAKRKDTVAQLHEVFSKRSNLRSTTASDITNKLQQDLDRTVLIVEADAQSSMDKSEFLEWMDNHFSGTIFRHREARFQRLLDKNIKPNELRSLLLETDNPDLTVLEVQGKTATEGGIDSDTVKRLYDSCLGRVRLEPEIDNLDTPEEGLNEVPSEISTGLINFPYDDSDTSQLRINDVLQLDEIGFDDIPVVKLNDRPLDSNSKLRPLEELSPGQRCSAILPILLITGSYPLIIDQPEDNMDNRLIIQVIVNILSSIKLRRQVIFATHNPNLPVLGDVEQAIILQGIGEKQCEVKKMGNLDDPDVVHHLTDIMEGGREAFQFRQSIYQGHWEGSVEKIEIDS